MFTFHEVQEFQIEVQSDGLSREEDIAAWRAAGGVVKIDRHFDIGCPGIKSIFIIISGSSIADVIWGVGDLLSTYLVGF